ncbi:MAG: hypothetical protein WAL66_10160, partial [Nitrososphaeraceae archaeon]
HIYNDNDNLAYARNNICHLLFHYPPYCYYHSLLSVTSVGKIFALLFVFSQVLAIFLLLPQVDLINALLHHRSFILSRSLID